MSTALRAVPQTLRALLLALLIALINGGAYLIAAPPWQHYDEPSHFEYAWLIANRGQLPLPGDVDREARTIIFESMARNRFFGDLKPTLPADGSVPEIGITQLTDKPTYYLLAALAIGAAKNMSIETQLYAARAVSLLLLLVTVVCGWGVAARMTAPGHALRWLLPCTLALLPAFVDLMTAVNNDALAIAAYSLFLWGAVRWLQPVAGERSDLHAFNALWIIAAAGLCYLSKGTAITAIPIAALALVIGLFAPKRRFWIITGMAIAATIGMTLVFKRDDSAAWYRTDGSRTSLPIRCDAACGAPVSGAYAIRVAPGSYQYSQAYVFQSLPPSHTAHIRGKEVRVSGWLWTNQNEPLQTRLPWLGVNYGIGSGAALTVSNAPTYFSYTAQLPETAHYVRLVLPGVAQGTVMYDDISLTLPEDKTAENLLRNPSGEQWAFRLTESAMARLDDVSPEWFSWPLTVSSLQDLRGTGWYYLLAVRYLFETLWIRFAWGQIALGAPWFVAVFGLTTIAVLGAFKLTLRKKSSLPWSVILIMGLSIYVLVVPTVTRAIIWGLEERLYAPPIRYAMPGAVAIAGLLAVGWHEILRYLPARARIGVCIVCALILNAAALSLVSR